MPEWIQLFRVFVGNPSDVIAEVQTIEELIAEWNRTQGPTLRARIEFANWRTHSYPAAGARPQSLINKQVVDGSDIIVGIIRRQLGSPTGKAASGTVEEIERGIRQRKSVMVYFANLPERKQRPPKHEAVRIEQFKRRLGQHALYSAYTSQPAFEKAFRQHLADAMRELLKRKTKQPV